MGCRAVLMKGGHLSENESPDWLFSAEGEQRFTAPRVATRHTHGTGCTLSAALAALRPRHADWAATVAAARTTCNKRCNRRARWKWGTVSGRCIISMPGGESTFATTVV